MAATTLFFNGQLTAKPGAQTEVDASALDVASPSATGIVALLGLAVGGRPWNAVTKPSQDLQRASSTSRSRKLFRSGDLLEMPPALFSPSEDDLVPNGAQEIVFVKVNPAAQSAATFVDGSSNDALTLTSADWGLFTTQISVLIEDATLGAPAKKVTITLEDDSEVFDDLGASAKFTLQYATGATTATRATADAGASSFEVDFERDDAGQDSLVTTQATGGASIEVLSSDVGDTTQTVTVYGLDATNTPQSQTVTLSGTSPVAVPGTWNLETAVVLSAACAGTVTVRNAAGAVVIFDVPAATLEEGRSVVDIPVDDPTGGPTTLTIEADGATTQDVIIRGIAQNTAALAERVTLTGTTPVALSGLFARVTAIELADVEAARTLTLKGRMVYALHATYPTLQKLRDKVNAETDFTLISVIGNPKEFNVEDLDLATAVDIKNPATGSFFARLYDVIEGINAASQLVVASKASPGNLPPDNTVSPVFLTGGHEGDALNPAVPTAQQTDWQGAIDLLKQVRVNSVLPATDDASIHALVSAHCSYMGGVGKSERDGFASAAANETKSAIKARALALNTRHMRLWAQEVDRFDTAGDRVTQDPKFGSAILAGMQAGSAVGEPLTNKQMNVLGIRQNADWNPVDDASEMILAGVVIGEEIDGVGIKVVRNVTTHLSSSNRIYTEAAANEALNYFTYNFRNAMQKQVGRKGFAGTVKAGEGIATKLLGQMLEGTGGFTQVLTNWRSLRIVLVGDTLEVEVEVQVVEGINFIPITVNLFSEPITA
jgi:hypothetical protein